MKDNCYSLCKTVVLVNPNDNEIFVSPFRFSADAKFSTSKLFANKRALHKKPCPANVPLSIPINDLDMNKELHDTHSEKQIARWFIKKSEYNESFTHMTSIAYHSLLLNFLS